MDNAYIVYDMFVEICSYLQGQNLLNTTSACVIIYNKFNAKRKSEIKKGLADISLMDNRYNYSGKFAGELENSRTPSIAGIHAATALQTKYYFACTINELMKNCDYRYLIRNYRDHNIINNYTFVNIDNAWEILNILKDTTVWVNDLISIKKRVIDTACRNCNIKLINRLMNMKETITVANISCIMYCRNIPFKLRLKTAKRVCKYSNISSIPYIFCVDSFDTVKYSVDKSRSPFGYRHIDKIIKSKNIESLRYIVYNINPDRWIPEYPHINKALTAIIMQILVSYEYSVDTITIFTEQVIKLLADMVARKIFA